MKINNNNPLFNLPTAQEIIAKLKSVSGNSSNNKKTIPQIVDEFIKVTPIALKSLSPTSSLSSTQNPALTTGLEPAQVSQQVKGINFDTKSQGLTNEREKSLTEALDKLLQVPFARDIIKNLESKGLGSDNNQIKVSIDNFEPPFATASNSVSLDGSNIKFQESYFDNSSTDTLAYTLFNELFDIWGRTTFGDAPYTPEFQALGSVGNKIVASYFSGEELDKNDLAQVFNGFYSQYNDYFSQYGIDKAASTEFSDLDKATQSLTGGVFTSFYGKDGLLETALKPENNPPQALINDYVIATGQDTSLNGTNTLTQLNTNQPDLLNISTNINSNALIVQPGGNASFSLNNYNVSAQPTGATRSYTYTLNNQTQTATTKAAFETAVNTAIAALPVNNGSTAPYQLSFRVEDNVNDPFFGTTTNTARFVQRVIVNGDTTGAGLVLGSTTVNEGAGLDSATKIDSKDANGITDYSYSIDGGTTKTYKTPDDLLNALDGDVAALTGKATPYQIAFSVKDSLNTTKTYSPTSLTVVNQAPTIAASDFYIGLDGTTANVKAVDPEGKALTYLYEINTGGNNWVPIQTNTNVPSGTNNTYDFKNVTSLASGAYSVRATAKDSNNQSVVSETRSVTLPNKAPTVGGFTLSGTNNLTATVTGSDPEGNNPLSYEFLIETAPGSNSFAAQQAPSASNTYTYNTSALTTGATYKVAVIVRDAQNNASPVTLGGQIVVPNKPPAVNSFQVVGNTATVAATDPESDALLYDYKIETAQGSNVFTTQKAASSSNSYAYDINNGAYTTGQTIKVQAVVTDSKGNAVNTATDSIIIPNRAPTISSFTTGGSGGVTATVNATDPQGDTLAYDYQIETAPGSNIFNTQKVASANNTYTYDVSGLTQGNYKVQSIVKDPFGNQTVSNSSIIAAPGQSPIISNFSVLNQTATVNATDGQGESLTYSFEIETAPNSNNFTTVQPYGASNSFAYNLNGAAYTAGQQYKVRALVKDASNNISTSSTQTIVVPQKTPTISSFTTSGPGGLIANVTATDPQGDILAYDYQIETAPGSNTFSTQKTASPNSTYTYDATGLAQGSYKVQAIAKDPYGNQAVSNTSTISVSSQSPTINSFGLTGQTATVSATDPQGDALTYAFEIETAPNSNSFSTAQSYGAGNTYTYNLSGAGYTPGQQYKVRALVKDAVNNVSTSTTQTITVPQKAPTINSFGVSGLTATVGATDPQGDSVTFEYQIETAPGSNSYTTVQSPTLSNSYTYNVAAPSFTSGQVYKVQAIVRDPQNNATTTGTQTITVPQKAPTVSNFSMTGLTANVTATDPQGDPITYDYQIFKNGNWETVNSTTSPTYTYSTTGLLTGQTYNTRAIANDNQGNATTSLASSISFPNQAPTIASINVAGASVIVNATDPNTSTGDTLKYTYKYFNGTSYVAQVSNVTSNTYSYVGFAPGTLPVLITVTDSSGLTADSFATLTIP